MPGVSLESMVGVDLTLEEKEFHSSMIVVEIGDKEFAYKYEKQERVKVAKCEFCSQRNILTVECECKRVGYCNQHCMSRDIRFH